MARVARMVFLLGFLIVASEGVRADYDPSRCPDARAVATAMINGLAPRADQLLGTGTDAKDIICTNCCQSPVAAIAEISPVSRGDVVASPAEARSRAETPLLLQFESLRPPRI